MIQKQNYISLEKRKVFDTPNQTRPSPSPDLPKTGNFPTSGEGCRGSRHPGGTGQKLFTMSGIAPTFATFGKTAEPTEQGKVGFRYLSLSEKRTHKWFSSQEPGRPPFPPWSRREDCRGRVALNSQLNRYMKLNMKGTANGNSWLHLPICHRDIGVGAQAQHSGIHRGIQYRAYQEPASI